MNIFHIISSIDVSTGGPARSVTDLLRALSTIKSSLFRYTLITIKSKDPILKNDKEQTYTIKFEEQIEKDFLTINETKENVSLVHIHGIWEPPTFKAAKYAKKAKVPFIYTIRGMLEPWSLQQNAFKKKIALLIYQRRLLKRAVCLHVTAQSEKKSLRDLGFKNDIAIIPNGLNLDNFPPSKVTYNNENGKRILFLSRIHPKKGLEKLIRIWSSFSENDKKGWSIDIVGNGDQSYIDQLNTLIISTGEEACITIFPPVFGKEKIKLFKDARLFILPTYSENFGVVVAEALASNTPVITTEGAPWKELNDRNAGWWTSIEENDIKIALKEAISCDDKVLDVMAFNGRKLIEDTYSIKAVASQMDELYEWLLGKKEGQPTFIDIANGKN